MRRVSALLLLACTGLAACSDPLDPAETLDPDRSAVRRDARNLPPLAAAASIFDIKPNRITSYGAHLPAGTYAYSTFDGQNTTFHWFLQNQEQGGPPVSLLDPAQTVFLSGPMFTNAYFVRAESFTIGRVEVFPEPPFGAAEVVDTESGLVVFEFTSPPAYFWGCTRGDPDPQFEEYAYVRTCPSAGLNGWLVFEIVVQGNWTLEDITTSRLPIGDVKVRSNG